MSGISRARAPRARARARAWIRGIAIALAWLLVVGSGSSAHAAEGRAAEGRGGGLGLRMRTEPPEVLDPEAHRAYDGPTAIKDEPGREVEWLDPAAPPGEAAPAQGREEPSAPAAVTPTVPPPSSVRDVPEHILVAVGLAPEAPGSREEKARLDALEAHARASTNPTTEVRRLRPGAGAPQRLCREHREDLVVMIGYIADRPAPVVLAHDCRLDRALGVRAADATDEPGLVAALWREHLELVRDGARERRRVSVGPKARAGIIAGVVIVVVGVAVGALIGSALRKETVVITVRP